MPEAANTWVRRAHRRFAAPVVDLSRVVLQCPWLCTCRQWNRCYHA